VSVTHSALERVDLFVGQSVSLGDDWDEVDLGVESAHDFDVQRLERVTGRLDEVNTSVYTVVDNVHAVDFVLGVQVSIKSLLNVLHDGSPRVVVVDKVTEAWSINNVQPQANTILFNVGADRLDRDGLWCKVEAWLLGFLWRIERGVEEGVYKSRLSKARFTYIGVSKSSIFGRRKLMILTNDHNVKVEPLANTLAMPLVWQVCKSDKASQLSTNDILHVACGLGCSLWIPRCDGLGHCVLLAISHWIAAGD